jgi:1-acyl-sn-glycerol-3-phosphate acyltransferase
MIQPTPEQLQSLAPVVRFWFGVADFFLRFLRPMCIVWNQIVMVHFSWLMTGPRVRRWGMEHLDELGPQDCIIFVANHRSFFDFYVIGPVLYTRTRLSKRILFPVRSPFFYDSWFGGIVNAIMSAFFMFPPIMRGKENRAFNAYALDRMVAELERPGTLLGVHPEGTRCKDEDPYAFLRPQPGVGTILSRSPHTRVIPVFVTGLSNSMGTEFSRTWSRSRGDFPIDVMFGAPLAFEALRAKGSRLSIQMQMAMESMDAVATLAAVHKKTIIGEE